MLAVRILAVIGGSLAVAWVLWSAIRTVVVPRGEAVWLSRKVFIVVRELFEFAGRRTRSYEGYDRTIDSHIKSLRRKLEGAGAPEGVIQTVRGVGYRLAASGEAAPPSEEE